MKIISYSLFGFNKEREQNSFDFNSYIRGFMINVRLQRLIYPGWTIRLYTDTNTYIPFKKLFDNLPIQVKIMQNDTPLCKAMLWRMMPAFEKDIDAVICRDCDSPLTYKEAQCVQYWMNRGEDKILHAITDSISHNVPLMGGMIGVKPKYFTDKSGCTNWEHLINKGGDYTTKGTDQDLLNRTIYPMFAQQGNDSIVQHYLLGMPNTFLSEYHNTVPQLELSGVLVAMKESNETCGHIGSAGYYNASMDKFLHKHYDRFEDIRATEKPFEDIFYWIKEKSY